MKLKDMPVTNSNIATLKDRLERLFWMIEAIDFLSCSIAGETLPDKYSSPEAAEMISAIAWEANVELSSVEEYIEGE